MTVVIERPISIRQQGIQSTLCFKWRPSEWVLDRCVFRTNADANILFSAIEGILFVMCKLQTQGCDTGEKIFTQSINAYMSRKKCFKRLFMYKEFAYHTLPHSQILYSDRRHTSYQIPILLVSFPSLYVRCLKAGHSSHAIGMLSLIYLRVKMWSSIHIQYTY